MGVPALTILKILKIHIILLIAVLLQISGLSAAQNTFPAPASGGAVWTLHPSFDNAPIRVVDTPDATYYFVYQWRYRDSLRDKYAPVATAIFVGDKKDSSAEIVPLGRKAELHSSLPIFCDYNPEGGYLLIGYEDGYINIVENDYRVTEINALPAHRLPGSASLEGVSFYGKDAIITTPIGFTTIDGEAFGSRYLRADIGIDKLCRAGDFYIALSGADLYKAHTVGKDKERISFTKLALADDAVHPLLSGNELRDVKAFLSLSDGRFAIVAGNPRGNLSIGIAAPSGDGYKLNVLADDAFTQSAAGTFILDAFESNAVPVRDGYLLHTPQRVYLLRRDQVETSLLTYKKRDESAPAVGSWDFSDFYVYRERGRFVRRNASGEGDTAQWRDIGAAVRPDAPAPFKNPFMCWSARYGMLVNNHSIDHDASTYSVTEPLLLSAFSEGKWKDLSPVYQNPAFTIGNDELKSQFLKVAGSYPVADPRGVTPDPLYPDYVFMGSLWDGIAALNMQTNNAIILATDNNAKKALPGFRTMLPTQHWGTLCSFSNVDYDNDGVLWAGYFNYDGIGSENGATKPQVMFWTPSARRVAMETGSPSSAGELGVINIPYDELCGNMIQRLIALRHPSNSNIIIYVTRGGHGTLFIIDHKGTLDNAADDEIKAVSRIDDGIGGIWDAGFTFDIAEDPLTGEVIFSTELQQFVINPHDAVSGGVISGKRLSVGDEGEAPDYFLNMCKVKAMVYDEYGRLWLGTERQGIYCLSPGRKEILYHFKASESPLPSDVIFGLGWDRSSGSLFASTECGLAQVKPDLRGLSGGSSDLRVTPANVLPGFNGDVVISGIAEGEKIIVSRNDGTTVKEISAGPEFSAWDLMDYRGEPVKSGVYVIRSGGASAEINVLR